MSRNDTKELFFAKPVSIIELFQTENGSAGFRIPEYQRPYDWSSSNIERLIEDMLVGYRGLKNEEDSITFLGTIIMIDEGRNKEPSFDGRSFTIIDGQQRLTTFSLIAISLTQEILETEKNLSSNSESTELRRWLNDEMLHIKNRLRECIAGLLINADTSVHPFPRICRGKDARAKSKIDANYQSIVGHYLYEFFKYFSTSSNLPFSYDFKALFPENTKAINFKDNVRSISKCLRYIAGDEISLDFSTETIQDRVDYKNSAYMNLFDKLLNKNDEAFSESVLNEFVEDTDVNLFRLVRLISFASYFLDFVVVTVVKPTKGKYAFDIFDALNTTGEPLTAIQTFKPFVYQFEEDQKSYRGSKSEKEFIKLEKYVEMGKKTYDQQNRAKELIVSFALYLNGEKLTKKLAGQRSYLRSNYKSVGVADKRRFLRLFSEIATYRGNFWIKGNIKNQLNSSVDKEVTKMCLYFIYGLDHSLAVPILARYYHEYVTTNDSALFTNAVKALTAFIILRRGVTGGTAGIDTELRKIMEVGINGNSPLCQNIAESEQNTIIKISELQSSLRYLLSNLKVVNINKGSDWVNSVVKMPLYNYPGSLTKFIIFLAAHNARPTIEDPLLLKKQKPSIETDYLTDSRWLSDECETIEHIAPQTDHENNWPKEIYLNPWLLHGLGNLVLLPSAHNSSVGNAPWKRKKIFYEAFAAESEKQIKAIISKAKKQKIDFGDKTIELLLNHKQLPIAKTVHRAPIWDKTIIEKRSKNIAQLAWDEVSGWLGY